jgi:hypothetical protein
MIEGYNEDTIPGSPGDRFGFFGRTTFKEPTEEDIKSVLFQYKYFGFKVARVVCEIHNLNIYDLLAKHHIKGG